MAHFTCKMKSILVCISYCTVVGIASKLIDYMNHIGPEKPENMEWLLP